MKFSIVATCLMLVVSTCQAQWGGNAGRRRGNWGDSNPSFGVRHLDQCFCNPGDECILRNNGYYQCQIVPNGRFYAPLDMQVQGQVLTHDLTQGLRRTQGQVLTQGRHRDIHHRDIGVQTLGRNTILGDGVIVGQGHVDSYVPAVKVAKTVTIGADCCQLSDYAVCATSLSGLRSPYTGGNICKKFVFDGFSCKKIDVYTSCVAATSPRNLFENLYDCQTKCNSGLNKVSKVVANKAIVGQGYDTPVVATKTIVGQGYDTPVVVANSLSQGYDSPVVMAKTASVIGQDYASPVVAKTAIGQDYVSPVVAKTVVGKSYVSPVKSLVKSINGGANCCEQQDYLTCSLQNIQGLHLYGSSLCEKFFFNTRSGSCQPIQVYSKCAKLQQPRNLFDNIDACFRKCGATTLTTGY